MAWVSVFHAEGREFESRSRTGAYPDRKKNRGMCPCGNRTHDINFIAVHPPDFFFLVGYLLCGSRFILSKFNCNTLGWKTVPFIR